MQPHFDFPAPAPAHLPWLAGDESPLNDLDESSHETDELPERDEMADAIEQLDEPGPMVIDPSQP